MVKWNRCHPGGLRSVRIRAFRKHMAMHRLFGFGGSMEEIKTSWLPESQLYPWPVWCFPWSSACNCSLMFLKNPVRSWINTKIKSHKGGLYLWVSWLVEASGYAGLKSLKGSNTNICYYTNSPTVQHAFASIMNIKRIKILACELFKKETCLNSGEDVQIKWTHSE